MTKRASSLIALVLALGASVLVAAEAPGSPGERLRRAVRGSIQELSTAYVAARPGRVVRDGLALLGVENRSKDAESSRIGETVAAYFDEELAKSTVFFLVERENLGKLLDEMELAMSGLLDENSAPDFPGFAAVDAVVVGSVVDAGDAFHVSFKLVDAAKGDTIAVSSFDRPKAELSAASVELQYEYVAANGIGTSLGAIVMPLPPTFFKSQTVFLFGDAAASYRLDRSWMLSVGTYLPMTTGTTDDYFHEPNRPAYASDDVTVSQPGLSGGGGYTAAGDAGLLYQGTPIRQANFAFSIAHLDCQYTLNFSPTLNLGIAAGILAYLEPPTMELSYGLHSAWGLLYRRQTWDETTGTFTYLPANDQSPVVYTFGSTLGPFAGVKAELKPEVFLTPRVALNARLGYLWTPPVYPTLVKAKNAMWYFNSPPDGVDPATWTPSAAAQGSSDVRPAFWSDGAGAREGDDDASSWTYYGWNPLIAPDGSRWTFDLSGFYAGIFVSLFF